MHSIKPIIKSKITIKELRLIAEKRGKYNQHLINICLRSHEYGHTRTIPYRYMPNFIIYGPIPESRIEKDKRWFDMYLLDIRIFDTYNEFLIRYY